MKDRIQYLVKDQYSLIGIFVDTGTKLQGIVHVRWTEWELVQLLQLQGQNSGLKNCMEWNISVSEDPVLRARRCFLLISNKSKASIG